jgi:hypothetical protein
MYDGQRINADDTPDSVCILQNFFNLVVNLEELNIFLCHPVQSQLEMEDGDQIQTMVQQLGGSL